MKTYHITRFSSIEVAGRNKFIVFNDLQGLPVYVDPDADYPVIKIFTSWDAAKTAALEIGNHVRAYMNKNQIRITCS